MFPYWNIGHYSFSMQMLMIHVGTAVAAFTVCFFLYQAFLREQKSWRTVIRYLVIPVALTVVALLVIGQQFGHLSRLLLWDAHTEDTSYLDYLQNNGGTHFIGQVLVLSILLPLTCRFIYGKRGMDAVLSCIAFYVPVQHIFSRVGCFLNGCCYGITMDGPLSIKFPDEILEYRVFPSQFFEILCMMVLLVFMVALYRKERPVFAVMVLSFSFVILFSEFCINKAGVILYAGLTSIQYIAIVTECVGIVLLIFESKRRKEKQFAQKGDNGKRKCRNSNFKII